jgi:hypothetical protein
VGAVDGGAVDGLGDSISIEPRSNPAADLVCGRPILSLGGFAMNSWMRPPPPAGKRIKDRTKSKFKSVMQNQQGPPEVRGERECITCNRHRRTYQRP